MSARQFNVPLGEPYDIALRQLTIRDRVSVPELLRPVVERFLDSELAQDSDLRASVEALSRSRRKRSSVAPVTPIIKARDT